jgi:hydrogenase-4 component B
MSLNLIIVALLFTAVSGLPGLMLSRASLWSQRIAVACMCLGSLAGLIGAGLGLYNPMTTAVSFPWPAMGDSLIGVDALSAFFLVPIFLMGGLGSIYGLGYWPQRRYPRTGKRLHVFWGGLVAGMALLVISKHAIAFLFGWEAMALSAFFLVSLEDHRPECRKAGLIYLMATHIGTLTLFGLFVCWRWATGSYGLHPVANDALSLSVMNGIFFLALLAFSLKAGVMPIHFWLPGAHTQAPSHVSAILSGVVLKMGIYGLLRILSLLPNPPATWGGLLLVLGAVSGLFGVVFALGQHDLKRLLAYHSVENIGIILMGMGLAMLGRSFNHPEWVVLGMAGCLLHVWNHSFFKSLLFFGAGSVVHATGTRQIDRLGGLAKPMPWTAAMFLVGAVAICGLPPLNGFISEWFVFLGFLRAGTTIGTSGSAVMIGAPILAMIGALAVACFVKVYGAVFLGTARTSGAAHAHEAPFSMRGPMLFLAAACAVIGLAPVLLSPILDAVIANFSGATEASRLSLTSVAPLKIISAISIWLLVCILALWLFLYLIGRVRHRGLTWDCGYAQPTSRMQYTASSFAQMIVSMFSWILRPRGGQQQVSGAFPKPAGMHTHVDDVVLDRVIVPGFHDLEQRFGWFRRFQQGLTQNYMLYILITVILMLSTLIPFKEIFAFLIAR